MDGSQNGQISLKNIITGDALAKYLGVSKGTLSSWRQNAGLPYLKPGARVFYVDQDVTEWMLQHRSRKEPGRRNKEA